MTGPLSSTNQLLAEIESKIPAGRLEDGEGEKLFARFAAAVARESAERVFLDAGEFCRIERSVEEFGEFIHRRGLTVLDAMASTCRQFHIPRDVWVVHAENAAAAAYVARLNELFTLTAGDGGEA